MVPASTMSTISWPEERTLVTDVVDDAQGLIEKRSAEALRNYYAMQRAKRLRDAALLKHSPNGERICASCAEPIDPRRITAMPDAVRCTECEKSQGRR